jgi:hypothetical protein
MTSKAGAKWTEAEASLPAELRPLLQELRADYVALVRSYVPKWRGGPNPHILAGLVRRGWSKSAGSN